MKARKLKLFALIGAISLILLGNRNTAPLNYKLKPKFSSKYKEVFSEQKYENLNMLGKITLFGVQGEKGKVLRALRLKNITDLVEKRYNLPENLLMAIAIQESAAVDMLPNGLGDGGFGFCHQQPSTAAFFGLKIYKNCRALICNGRDERSCRSKNGKKLNHAADLKNLILVLGFDRKLLINYDDRLHPILNLDATGRMLSFYMDAIYENLSPIERGIIGYSGKANYKAGYWEKVKKYMQFLGDKEYLQQVRNSFNEANPKLTIGGKKAGFDEYLKEQWKENYNYGLAEYKKLPTK